MTFGITIKVVKISRERINSDSDSDPRDTGRDQSPKSHATKQAKSIEARINVFPPRTTNCLNISRPTFLNEDFSIESI